MPSSQNPLQPMLAAIAGETCAGFNSTSPEVIITLIIFDHIWSSLTIFDHFWSSLIIFDSTSNAIFMPTTTINITATITNTIQHHQNHFHHYPLDCHHSHHNRIPANARGRCGDNRPLRGTQFHNSRGADRFFSSSILISFHFQRCWLIVFLSSSILISCHRDVQKVIFQVDLAGAVLANSTVGAEELISWACDQYIGNILWQCTNIGICEQYTGNILW